MAIAQMNWGQMLLPLEAPAMLEFSDALAGVYRLAEQHPGFIWRIPDDQAAQQLNDLGFDPKISATVSVWENVDALHDYTFNSLHGEFLKRASEWFAKVDGPQLVLWDVTETTRPTFKEAFEKLQKLRENGNTPEAYGWPNQL